MPLPLPLWGLAPCPGPGETALSSVKAGCRGTREESRPNGEAGSNVGVDQIAAAVLSCQKSEGVAEWGSELTSTQWLWLSRRPGGDRFSSAEPVRVLTGTHLVI